MLTGIEIAAVTVYRQVLGTLPGDPRALAEMLGSLEASSEVLAALIVYKVVLAGPENFEVKDFANWLEVLRLKKLAEIAEDYAEAAVMQYLRPMARSEAVLLFNADGRFAMEVADGFLKVYV